MSIRRPTPRIPRLGIVLSTLALALCTAPNAAKGDAVRLGQQVVTSVPVEVREQPSPGAAVVERHGAGKLGRVVAGPTSGGGLTWWQVDFRGEGDGWVPASQLVTPYFPSAESQGGWRSLVPYGNSPGAAQKSAVRARAGIDWDLLQRANEYSRSFTTSSAVLVIRNGYVVGEWGSRSRYQLASVAKSLAGLAVARLFDLSADGRLPESFGPDREAYLLLPDEWTAGAPEKRSIRIRHLMTMTSGLRPHDRPGVSDYRSVILGLPATSAPGERWAYASAPVDLLSMAAQRASGHDLGGTFNRQIAAKIGAAPFEWGKFGDHTRASSAVAATPRDLARVGYLVMMDGRWGAGSQQQALITAARVEALRSDCRCASSEFEPTPDSPFIVPETSPRHYGQLWWSNRTGKALGPTVSRDAFYAHGLRETLLIVVPSRNLVVVRFGTSPRSLPEFRREFMARVMASVGGASSY